MTQRKQDFHQDKHYLSIMHTARFADSKPQTVCTVSGKKLYKEGFSTR